MSAILDIGNVQITPYNPLDARHMQFRDRRLQQFFLTQNPKYFDNLQNAYTLYIKKNYAGIFGIIPMYYPFVEAYFFASQWLDDLFCKDFFRACLLIRDDLQSKFNRIQATVSSANLRDIKFVEKLGFTRECLMQKYGIDGEDHFLYSICR